MSFYKKHAPNHREHNRALPDLSQYEGMKVQREESGLPSAKYEQELRRIKEYGLEPADSIEDKTEISCFQRGSTPHWSGINTFLKVPYLEDIRKVGDYDVAFVGVPFDIGCTFRSGTRFGPQGIRRISSLYQKYSYEHGIDLGESLAMCDAGDIFCPANITKAHDQITKGIAHILSQGTFPMIMGGDHSIGFPTARGVAQCVDGKLGIIHLDRHVDTQEKDMDEIMHTCPWFHATNIPNCPPANLVQLGIGGWQVPRAGVKVGRERGTTILTVNDIEKIGIEKTIEIALEVAWKGASAVFLSFDIDAVDAGFVPGTGWPEPGGFLPREVLKIIEGVAKEGLAGMEIVEVSPPYDISDITSLLAARSMVDVLATMTKSMVVSAAVSKFEERLVAEPAFILTTDLPPGGPTWARVEAQAERFGMFAARAFGFAPRVRIACLPIRPTDGGSEHSLGQVIKEEIDTGAAELFVLPMAFELNVWQRAMLGQTLGEIRRPHDRVTIHHDDVNPTHPLLVDCFVNQLVQALGERGGTPQRVGLLLVADGQGDSATRADSYRLMRLLWEQTGVAQAEVGFVRHLQPFLRGTLERCLREPLDWLLLPQCQWEGELCDHARVMLADHKQAHSEAAGWQMLDPPQDHPAIQAWLEQRLLSLWQGKRARQAARLSSPKHQPQETGAEVWSGERWVSADTVVTPRPELLARVRTPGPLAKLLARVLPPAERYLVKVTWHGYAPGTYTSPAALDLLLGALPGKAVLLEGHTSSRNLGGADWDWETDTERHRAWIRQQDAEFLRRTGLMEVIARHGAQYVNVTEAWWDGACAPEEQVRSAFEDVALHHPELAGFVPSILMDLRGMPLLSVARFKGPTRLGISNLFGLIPHPLRTAWHGPNITYFASVCCDLARLYGSLFPLYGFVEAFESAVRWDRKGLYRSRWGNYDLVLTDGVFTLSEGLVGADILASRLQGQDVQRSGFYDVVRDRLGWSPAAATAPLPIDLQATLA